jgi:hypothetical protein
MVEQKFPDSPTANQLLDGQQFAFLLAAESDAVENVLTRREA